MADILRESSHGILSWLKKLRYETSSKGSSKEGGQRPRVLNMGVIGLKDNEFDRAVYKTLASRTSFYSGCDLNANYLHVYPDEEILEKQLISFLNTEEYHIVVSIGLIPTRALTRLMQKTKPRYLAVFTDVNEPIEHGIIDNPLTKKSIITGLEQLPVDYMKFVTAIKRLATRRVGTVLTVSSLHTAHFHPYENILLQDALKSHEVNVRKIVPASPDSLLRELAVHIDYIDAIMVPRDKMITPYADLLAKVARVKRVLLCVADSETKGAAFNFGMPGDKLGIQTSAYVKPIITEAQPIYKVKMQRPVDETVLKICKNTLYEQGSFLDRDEIENFDLCPFKILSE